jgi:hypothetical protein
MSEKYNEEPFHQSRKPILVGGDTPDNPAETADNGGALTTADLAGAGERRPADNHSTRVPVETARAETRTDVPAGQPGGEGHTPLFSAEEAGQFRSRWDAIQVGFVDEPRRSVEQADELVASTIKRLAQVFADERTKLEQQWSRGDQVSTEDLRLALQRYRSFFGRLLSI